jgi:predicted DNA-binding transcriptional regulator AlpA
VPKPLPENLARERILDTTQTAEMYGVSVVSLRRLYRAEKIPKPIKIGERKLGWKAGTVIDDIEARASQATYRDAP